MAHIASSVSVVPEQSRSADRRAATKTITEQGWKKAGGLGELPFA